MKTLIAPKNKEAVNGNFLVSAFESEFLKLNIGRNISPVEINFEVLADFIKRNQIKLFRLKADNIAHPDVVDRLHRQKLNAFYSHTVLNFRINYLGVPVKLFQNESLEFIKVNAENKDVFYQTILLGMSDDPIGYYKAPVINRIISKEKELLCYAKFYAENYSGSDSGKAGWLMKLKGITAATFVFELSDDEVYTSMACVLPEFRNHGLFHDMKVFRQKYCQQNGIKWASNGSRMYNIVTPNFLIREGYKLVNTETVMHIVA